MASSRKSEKKDIRRYEAALHQFERLKDRLSFQRTKLVEMRERSNRTVETMERRMDFLMDQWKTKAVQEQEEVDWQLQYAMENLQYNKSAMLTPREVDILKNALPVLEERVSRVTAMTQEAESVSGDVAKDSMQLTEVLVRMSSLETRKQELMGHFMPMEDMSEEKAKSVVKIAVKSLNNCGEVALAEDLKRFLSFGTSNSTATSTTTENGGTLTSGMASEEPISLPSSFPISCSIGSSTSESQN